MSKRVICFVIMMKRMAVGSLAIVGLLLLGVGKASANEGVAVLSGGRSDARCFLASVLVDTGDYRLVMSCRDLVLPPTSEKLFYHVWAKKSSVSQPGSASGGFLARGAYLSLGDLDNGKLSTRAREAFSEILVTQEKESDPSGFDQANVVVSGRITPIDFGSGTSVSPRPTDPAGEGTPTVNPSGQPTPSVSGQNVVGTAFRVFLTILGIIVVIAIVISLVQRRSASK